MNLALEQLNLDNSYARLGEPFGSRLSPTPFAAPTRLVSFNPAVAQLLDLDPSQAQRPEMIRYLSGQSPWPGSDPVAMCYSGHQFGHYVPQLGDGRAILLTEVRNQRGEKWDLQLKGSGLTPYSRQGDGRAVLRSTIREYLCSEAMHGLGIPTTRALCILASDEEVYRESIESGAMLLRVAPSHIRFGSFEIHYYREQHDALRTLADYVITQHYPQFADHPQQYHALLREVVVRTARLIAQWQAVGFAHGVMNTDNMSILGLTLDYGPFGFMQSFEPGYICNHSDHTGRYAFDQQPSIGLWNLSCLAQALTPLVSVDEAKQCLADYEPVFVSHYYELMRRKLGFNTLDESAVTLINDFLALLQQDACDYTLTFRAMSQFNSSAQADNTSLRDRFISRLEFDRWAERYSARLRQENSNDADRALAMNAVNPKYILRNHLAQIAIDKASKHKDYNEIDRLLTLLQRPFDDQPEFDNYAAEPPDWAQHIEVSCSS
ncbi:MAG: YdiU family protein [Gammaproteobacteria bacterium]|nr:YdiU family protein [Gammaproteobacteria bacterium]